MIAHSPELKSRLVATLAASGLILLLSLAPVTGDAALPAAAGELPMPTLAPMIKRVSPAIVNVATRGTIKDHGPQNPLLDDPFFRRFFDVPPELGPRERQFQSAGSGVIFDAKTGYILTNAHVIENASEITVTLQDGRDLTAKIIGTDALSDVAVLKIDAPGLTQIELGDSARVEVGDFVVAIGNPFGLQHTVTSGIVSGLGRSGINPEGFEDFIQTDASINPGNSGGALVNLRGELIGINSAIISRSGGNIGIGFAIPVNLARGVMEQLLKYGSVKRGLLGVNIYTVTPDIARSLGLANTQGALVSQVIEGSPAFKAGVKPGDVITSLNGLPIKSNAELRNAIGLLRVGDKVDIGIVRDGKPRRLSALVADTSPALAEPAAVSRPGSALHRGLEGASLADAPDTSGVTVQTVQSGSAAAQNGLRVNDVIVGVNRSRVTNLKELRGAVGDATTLVLNVRRGASLLLLPVR
jgi:Do/DeqQ family serine protease